MGALPAIVFPVDHDKQCLDDILGITMWERHHGNNCQYPLPRYYKSGMEIPKSILKFVDATHRTHLSVVRVKSDMIQEAQQFCGTYYSS